MTDVAELRPELRQWYEAWKTCLQNLLGQVSGQPCAFELSAQPLAIAESDVWFAVVAGGAVHGEMVLHLAADSGTLLAQKMLGETGPAAPGITAEHKEGLEELLRQAGGLAATALSASTGGEVKFSVSASAAPSWSSDTVFCLQSVDGAGTMIRIEMQISPALAAEIQRRAQAGKLPEAAEASAPASSYRRLLEVGLDVKLRFGIRHMLLRDVLALSPGVVVELESGLHSPVALLLDGRLVAQGEVVIVDGKYGLHVTEVVDVPIARPPA